MARISSKLRTVEGGRLAFWCPGCDCAHAVFINRPEHPVWKWNNDVDLPTFTPSLLTQWTPIGEKTPHTCHLFVNSGQIQFLGDCTHDLKSKTVPMPDWPWVD